MNLFKPKKSNNFAGASHNQPAMAEMVLNVIHDGVIMTDKTGVARFANPAATTMTGHRSVDEIIGLDYGLILKIETKEGRELSESENPLIQAIRTNQPLESFECCLVVLDKRVPVAISVLPSGSGDHIITFRDITKELAEEGEQTEFISTASHEMRTPVASIEGYLSLALNPQTATIDERAKNYLEAAHSASKHLGKLFQDLLDVTKLDDGRIRPQFTPVEMVSLVSSIITSYTPQANAAKIKLSFGSGSAAPFSENRRLDQVVYAFVDQNFLREILDNLIDNALKYTPAGGSVYANVMGDGDRVLINVTDTGMGISADDLGHIFQKFYRADNSDTRTVGGTGLGLYLVKQRVEAMGGRVWAESAFGEGSTFYVSLPRITAEEYEKRMIPIRNAKMQQQLKALASAPQPAPVATPASPLAPSFAAQPQSVPTSPPAPPVALQNPMPTPNNNLNGEIK